MKAIVHITDKSLYQKKVKNVEYRLNVINDESFSGQLEIETIEGQYIPYYGLLSAEEFENDYGFRLAIGSKIKATLISI